MEISTVTSMAVFSAMLPTLLAAETERQSTASTVISAAISAAMSTAISVMEVEQLFAVVSAAIL